MGNKSKKNDLILKIDDIETPFSKIVIMKDLKEEYDAATDSYRGEIRIYPAPIAVAVNNYNADGTMQLPYGANVDIVFGKDCTIRAKCLYLRGKNRIIEVGMMAGDIMHTIIPKSKLQKNCKSMEVESFAHGLAIMSGDADIPEQQEPCSRT